METNEKGYGVCAYLGILFLVPLLAGKTEFSRYHANQGLVLFILDAISGVIIGIVTGICGAAAAANPLAAAISGTAMVPVAIVSGILGLVIFIFMIIGIVNAVNGEMKPLPVIGNIKLIK